QHLHLEQGETAAGTKARTRTKRNVRGYVVRAGGFAEPAPRPEGPGRDEVIGIARRRACQHAHASSLRYEQITDHGLDFGFEHQDRGYRAETHRFVGNRASPEKLVRLLHAPGPAGF